MSSTHALHRPIPGSVSPTTGDRHRRRLLMRGGHSGTGVPLLLRQHDESRGEVLLRHVHVGETGLCQQATQLSLGVMPQPTTASCNCTPANALYTGVFRYSSSKSDTITIPSGLSAQRTRSNTLRYSRRPPISCRAMLMVTKS